MEERHGMRGTVVDEVFFTEQTTPNARALKRLHVEISRQNANLGEVKKQLALQVRECGGNALVNFRYGQRAHKWWENLTFKWDTESWHGEGEAIRL